MPETLNVKEIQANNYSSIISFARQYEPLKVSGNEIMRNLEKLRALKVTISILMSEMTLESKAGVKKYYFTDLEKPRILDFLEDYDYFLASKGDERLFKDRPIIDILDKKQEIDILDMPKLMVFTAPREKPRFIADLVSGNLSKLRSVLGC